MYKVFINEKSIIISNNEQSIEKRIIFDGALSIEIALDLIQNTSCQEINIFGKDTLEIWQEFSKFFKIIHAAGGIVYNEKSEILFIYRLGKWDLPKGKVEKGESFDDAAIREVEEETGYSNLKLEKFINSTYHIYTERNGERILKNTHWYKMNYSGTQKGKPQLEEGITELSWKDKQAIQRDVIPATFKNIQLILTDEKLQEE
jgi:hydroxymethylpyrimidine pyrophosphatase-like HAD family hydrolase